MHFIEKRTSVVVVIVLALCSVCGLVSAQVNPITSALDRPAAAGANCQPFIPATFYLENSDASSLGPGDFNGDGILDFAVRTLDAGNDSTLTILLGKSDGTFIAGKTYSIGTNSDGFPMAIGDFNGDGNLDVVVTNGSGVVVFLGNGDGTFRSGKQSTVQGVIGIAIGDFNQDGKLDIAVASFNNSSDVEVMLGNGDGTFARPVSYGASDQPYAVTAADFNHDGHLDLAVANGFGNTVSVLLGNGDGTFRSKVDYQVSAEPVTITAADLNGDGNMDLATAGEKTVSVLLNKGDGTFLPATDYAAGANARAITAAPLDAGSKPSLAVATTAGTYILVNKGNGTFNSAQGYEPVSSGIVMGDFNGDGKTDLAVAGGYRDEGGVNGVTILSGAGNGVFATPSASFVAFNLESVALADFTSDGHLDLAAISGDGGPLLIFRGEDNGGFLRLRSYSSFTSNLIGSRDLAAIAEGDFNMDGNIDLAIVLDNSPSANREVQIYKGDGAGDFTATDVYPVQGGYYPSEVTVADFNGDGVPDIAVSGNGAVDILLGNGDGTFQSATSYAAGAYARIAVGDFNEDGKLDFAVTDSDDSSLYIYTNRGDGTFGGPKSYSLTFKPSAIAAGDFNGDGKLDLAVGEAARQSTAGSIQILLGVGNGTFQPGALLNAGYAPVTGDFDGDGKLDLAVLTVQGLLEILFGNGDGTFTPGADSSIGQDTDFFAVADLNGDGAPDLLVPNYGGGEISVLLNQCASK
jgi:hypothetical protein